MEQHAMMTTIRTSDPRRYVWLAGTLEDEIESGKYTPGERLPSIRELCLETGLSRHTAGKALRILEEEGQIERVPGLGYFVPPDEAVERASPSCPQFPA
jgi:DNA-binding GntR family transcriptional regulator